MIGLRILYRFLGIFWLILGVFIVIIAGGYLIPKFSMNTYLLSILPNPLLAIIPPILSNTISRIQQMAGILFGIFCIVFGIGIITFRGWARTIGISFHIIIGLSLFLISFLIYSQINTAIAQGSVTLQFWTGQIIIIGVVLLLGMLILGYQLSTHSAIEAFSGHIPTPPPMPPVKCPTCGGLLDLEKARCPKCDAGLDKPITPTRAKLIQEVSGQEYPVSTRRETRIGRDTPEIEISLNDPTISADHALIEFVDGHFYLHARKDTNGTYVNNMERRIRDIEINDEDHIMLGRVRFIFSVEYDRQFVE